jgi:hypothetical protein
MRTYPYLPAHPAIPSDGPAFSARHLLGLFQIISLPHKSLHVLARCSRSRLVLSRMYVDTKKQVKHEPDPKKRRNTNIPSPPCPRHSPAIPSVQRSSSPSLKFSVGRHVVTFACYVCMCSPLCCWLYVGTKNEEKHKKNIS